MAGTLVLVRDDDVGEWTDPLAVVVDLFMTRGIPVAYAVIPSKLTPEAAERLVELAAANPELVSLHQHGHVHEQVVDGEHRWSEFDGRRPRDDQRAAIVEGRAILRSALGSRLDTKTFTPPAHKYDAVTIDVLDDLGFEVISASIYHRPAARVYYLAGRLLRRIRWLGKNVSYHTSHVPRSALTEFSVSVDVDQDGSGRRVSKSTEQLESEFAYARRHTSVVGLMLHHECYEDPQKLTTLERFIDELAGDASVVFASLDECRRLSGVGSTAPR